MTLKLNQIIPIVRDFKKPTQEETTGALRAFENEHLFEGHIHDYERVDEEGEQLPQEKKIPQLGWREILSDVFGTWGKYGNHVAMMDVGNQSAAAAITVDGTIVVELVPATHLIWLEKALIDVRTLVNSIPLLDPSVTWTWNNEQGYFESDAIQTLRRVKTKKPITLAAATHEHPAQVQLVDADETVGTWNKVRQSKAIPHPTQQAMLGQIEKLLVAIKQARARANAQEIDKQECLSIVLDSILAVADQEAS